MQLVAEFKRLGSIIVFANFNKIIVCTKKHTIADAIGYVEFVVKSIRNKELFHSIEITYNQCWEYLQWLDMANHGGVQGKLPNGLSGVGESQITDEVNQNDGSDDDDDSEGVSLQTTCVTCVAFCSSYLRVTYHYCILLANYRYELEPYGTSPRRSGLQEEFQNGYSRLH